jgi:eukaryotic-like serine/threonine-protein kinase
VALASGSKLGPYEIVAPLGAGGMGEVYRARDTRLERDVAIKVLPATLTSDPSLRQRLEREAKAVSKLSHPHICTLHDVGQQSGMDYLVMELLDGETLEQRLNRGPLPMEQVLRYAVQIADALAKAHKLGIVHRDLKPANIMLTKAGAKLMDFGLAKASGLSSAAEAPTEITIPESKLTVEGMIVGTFQYMAPEQLEGREIDARTDVFALGAVIYEMATGKAAFAGQSRASTIAAILSLQPPPMASAQPMIPPALERVVRKSLAKDPEERWQNVSDLASELRWIAEGHAQVAGPEAIATRGTWERAAWIVAVVSLLLLFSGVAVWWKSSSHTPAAMWFQAAIPFAANDLAISPDGRQVVMVAYAADVNDFVLWTYQVGGQRAIRLEGTQGASYPFWSPDEKFLGFFADGKLKKLDLAGGRPLELADAPNGRGGTWSKDGVILFAPDALGALQRVSSQGGTPVEASKLDTARSEAGHRWPVFLPDGKHFLYLAANFSGRPGINAVFEGSLDSPEKTFVVSTSANVAFAEPGYLLYLRDKTLVAQAFDPRHGVLSGEPHTLSDEVLYFSQVYRAVFDVSGGTLLTQAGKGINLSQLEWIDRQGKLIGTVGRPLWYNNVQLSPDGRRITADETDPDGHNTDVWMLDPARDATTRLTFDPALDTSPVWSPDGQRLAYSSNRSLNFRLYLKNADGSGGDQEFFDGGDAQINMLDWSRDGKYILIRHGRELWSIAWPEHTAKPIISSKWMTRGGQFSPDGRWVAYSSNESGRMEVYVMSFGDSSGKWQVSNGGGSEPRWRQDGKELFFLASDGKMMATPVVSGTGFEAGSPVTLFQTHRRQPISSQDLFSYAVSNDGQRFLFASKLEETGAAPLTVVLNWDSLMQQ